MLSHNYMYLNVCVFFCVFLDLLHNRMWTQRDCVCVCVKGNNNMRVFFCV